ncbi:hypothetical protein [Nocardioides speluncae]|uniref:hypothetical protein n=1 Tax=Nocardioides speluncae TaxID=2670337 RepID=UPI000D69D6EE|nr:hypothetical protein [Nocardioides speluncae]
MARPSPSQVAALALALPLAACSTVDSADLRTSGIYAHIRVEARSADSEVAVSLSAGGLTSIELSEGDELAVAGGGAKETFDHHSLLGSHGYTAVLDGLTEPDEEVVVTLKRDDDPSTTSRVRLPEPIEAGGPRRASRREDLLIRVNDGPGTIRVSWEGGCVAPGGDEEYAEGEPVVVPSGALRPYQAETGQLKPPKRCLVTFTVSRVRSGSLDDEFKGGSIEAVRSTSFAVRSVP